MWLITSCVDWIYSFFHSASVWDSSFYSFLIKWLLCFLRSPMVKRFKKILSAILQQPCFALYTFYTSTVFQSFSTTVSDKLPHFDVSREEFYGLNCKFFLRLSWMGCFASQLGCKISQLFLFLSFGNNCTFKKIAFICPLYCAI